MYAQGVALSKMPRRIRQVAYEGLDVRDWDVEMAYFTIAAQVVDRLRAQIKSPYFSMSTLKLYIRDRSAIWASIRETADLSNDECKRLCIAVFNGEAIEGGRYVDNAYLRNIAREGRAMRWISCHMIHGLYERLTEDGEKMARSQRAVLFPSRCRIGNSRSVSRIL